MSCKLLLLDRCHYFCIVLAVVTVGVSVRVNLYAQDASEVSYASDVLPILQAKCFRCHNGQRSEGGLRLDLKNAALKGGDSGHAFIPGNSDQSLLLQRINSDDEFERMPQEAAKLTGNEIRLLTQWIREGAKGLHDVKQSEHWAFQMITDSAILPVKDQSWPRSPMDYFVLAMLEQEGLRPAPRALDYQLIRRLSFDLLGMPPTVEEVKAFETNSDPDAYQQLVERLLSDPRFGERWGRHWLDLARYADSSGYEADRPRKIWHYRDWVIRAMNQDKPITKFVIEQIGGDLLPQATEENRVASGFHCNAMLDGGVREQAVLDRVNSTGAVFLGLTLECAQCHDHKTDPVTQKEYYQLFAFFHGASAVPLDLSPPELKNRIAQINQQVAVSNEQIAKIDVMIKDNLEKLVASALTEKEKIEAGILTLLKVPAADRSEAEIRQLELYFQSKNTERIALIAKRDELQSQQPEPETTLVFAQDNRKTHLFVRGNPRQLGEEVQSNTPAFLHEIKREEQQSEYPDRVSLGEWIVARENPLFARVMANRIWLRLMGKAIVESEDDFGVQTARPRNLLLLDHLATLIQQQDSFKSVIRSIVLSATYQQSSDFSDREDGNEGLFQGQQRFRLEVEVLRDNALAVAGLLENQIGGPSVFPPQQNGILDFRATPATWIESQGADRYRRGMYTYIWRLTPHPMTAIFDGPELTTSCTRRTSSNVALQALALLNDPLFVEAAQAFAKQLLLACQSEEERIEFLFSRTLNRQGTQEEISIVRKLLAEQLIFFNQDTIAAKLAMGAYGLDQSQRDISPSEQAAWVAVCRAIMNLDEFIMRE
ncbi:MAG: hypothetical protein CMJ76_03915 [Planctomycetaceae bacterium]|nr:hypothetical protein [Planctomycetaceae bacterium]